MFSQVFVCPQEARGGYILGKSGYPDQVRSPPFPTSVWCRGRGGWVPWPFYWADVTHQEPIGTKYRWTDGQTHWKILYFQYIYDEKFRLFFSGFQDYSDCVNSYKPHCNFARNKQFRAFHDMCAFICNDKTSKGLFTPSERETDQSSIKKDERLIDKHQGKFSLSLLLLVGVNGP